jgi:hypothetical protein
MTKIVILFSGNFDVEGQVRHYEEGEIVEVPQEDANRLVTCLIAEIYKEPKKEVHSGRKNNK